MSESEHKWGGCRAGGNPANAESYEFVRYCEICGIEDTCEDPMPPCETEQLPHDYLPCTCYGPEHCRYCGYPEYHLNHKYKPSLPARIFESIRITEENTWKWCAAIVGVVAILTLLGLFL